ncbi:hypothetical protein A9Z42_0091050 [Trichoderma parareesei]|uniref:Uncharacterized protein n=1 Tax=Trichoderma parareesei TaxID=858221 RepID=A0A2H2ZLG2_TRIPA|nr:hypothetical protein A9Z42_0091050 [Trichoderma parareesei]
MSSRGSSLGIPGAPPPMPTIKAKEMLGKLRIMLVAAVAAAFVPVDPAGRHAITTLCAPIRPRV